MFFDGLAILIIIVAVGFAYCALRILWRRGWIGGFVRGLSGLTFTLLGTFFILVALDFFSYQTVLEEKSIAHISFERLGTQYYRAELVDEGGVNHTLELRGDQWQLDARIIKWPGFLAGLGVKPGYRLDRISGRYYSLEKERSAERTVYELGGGELGIDIWTWVHRSGGSWGWIDAEYGNATYLPMEDGAIFEVSLTATGLVARPMNEAARTAISRWD